jgi:sulfur carrier protein ThiS adenylyltransferase
MAEKPPFSGDPLNLIRVRPAKEGIMLSSHGRSFAGSVFYFMMKPFDARLRRAVVGIAGLGGLGSMVAVALVRTGVGRLLIADFDRVEQGNLNRQHYFFDQVGRPKVEALMENLRRIDAEVVIEPHDRRLDSQTIPEVFAEAHVIAECFDRADQKQMIVETVLSKMRQPIVSVSGLAGYGDSNAISTRRISQRLILIGDGRRGVESGLPLTAGRVWIAAAHQANAIVELLLDEVL